jgi:hypothetical protein
MKVEPTRIELATPALQSCLAEVGIKLSSDCWDSRILHSVAIARRSRTGDFVQIEAVFSVLSPANVYVLDVCPASRWPRARVQNE